MCVLLEKYKTLLVTYSVASAKYHKTCSIIHLRNNNNNIVLGRYQLCAFPPLNDYIIEQWSS